VPGSAGSAILHLADNDAAIFRDSVAMKAGAARSTGIVRVLPFDLVRFRASPAYDVLMRVPLLAFYVAAAAVAGTRLLKYERDVDPMLPDDLYAINIAMQLAVIGFLVTIAATAVMRLRPRGRARGLEPRVSALIGTCLISAVVFFPLRQLPFITGIVSTVLVLVGNTIAIYCLSHLGRAFSIMPEARELVTSGLYKYLRHPLYLAEMIAATGIVMQYLSVWTALMLAVEIAVQLRRMSNEENVLMAVLRHMRNTSREQRGSSPEFTRPDVRLRAGRPVSQYAGSEGCAGLAGAEPHA
jgi:protein-S-isoprenylcysteine O-methyltransferase Ste14